MPDIRKSIMILGLAGGDVTVLTDEERNTLVEMIDKSCQDSGIELSALGEPDINLN